MKMLALDTSSTACTVALGVGDDLLECFEVKPQQHTHILMPMIREVLDEAGIGLAELDAIVLGNGPGSFIGMRIAASVAQGLAHGAGLGIITVSSLAAVAAEVFSESDAALAAVAQDAHMSEVYLGLFSRDAGNLPKALGSERLQPTTETIAELLRPDPVHVVAAGQGWQRYPELLQVNEHHIAEVSAVLYPNAKFLLGLAVGRSPIDPRDIEPAYLRQKVAEKPAAPGS